MVAGPIIAVLQLAAAASFKAVGFSFVRLPQVSMAVTTVVMTF
ncbi:hypothetical protein O9992_26380 [Vibrio lentus]|nr:hypothetical protein [Vibrio lentus]